MILDSVFLLLGFQLGKHSFSHVLPSFGWYLNLKFQNSLINFLNKWGKQLFFSLKVRKKHCYWIYLHLASLDFSVAGITLVLNNGVFSLKMENDQSQYQIKLAKIVCLFSGTSNWYTQKHWKCSWNPGHLPINHFSVVKGLLCVTRSLIPKTGKVE